MKNILLNLLAIFLLISCQDSRSKPDEKTNNDLRKDNGENKPALEQIDSEKDTGAYTISAPKEWTRTTEIMMGHEFTLLRSPGEGTNDKFLENINVVVETTGNVSLEEYAANSLLQMKTLKNFEKKNTSRQIINGIEFGTIDYSHSYGNIAVEARLYYAVKNGKTYVITCSAGEGSFAKWENKFKEAVGSFKIN